MGIKTSKFVLYGKIEADYGVDPTCAVADVLTASNVNLDKIFNPQALKVGSKSEYYKSLPGHQLAALSFDIPLTRAITNGVAGEITKLLQACCWGLASGEDNQFDVLNEPESDSSMYFEYYHDGVKEIISGARGSASFKLEAGLFPMVSFTFTGLYNSVSAVALPAITTYKHGTLFPVKANTLKIGGTNYHSFILNFSDGNVVSILRDANATEGVYMLDVSDCDARGDINVLVESANAATLEALVENSTSSTILFEYDAAGVGDAKNPVISITAIFEDVTREEVEGFLYYTMPFVITAIDIDIETAAA